LRKLQERLNDYVDIAVDGHLASLHPSSRGKVVTIRVDAYDTPRGAVRGFVERFARYVEESSELQDSIAEQGFVRALDFECNERGIN
jgi:hypothetical protein